MATENPKHKEIVDQLSGDYVLVRYRHGLREGAFGLFDGEGRDVWKGWTFDYLPAARYAASMYRALRAVSPNPATSSNPATFRASVMRVIPPCTAPCCLVQ
jgi:hypothetical protein